MNKICPSTWPIPDNVHAYYTTRPHGVSTGCYTSLNLASHVGDTQQDVDKNRRILMNTLSLPDEPVWLNQVHSDQVVEIKEDIPTITADASHTQLDNKICAVLTADCLPILICNQQGSHVGAIHAGWRGLQQKIIQNCIDEMGQDPSDLSVWLGPAISQNAYEVDPQFRQHFLDLGHEYQQAFIAGRPGHYYADLYTIATIQLKEAGITAIYGGNHCTYNEKENFFSYRRDGEAGRQACLIYFT